MRVIWISLVVLFFSSFTYAEMSANETLRFVDSKDEPRTLIEVDVSDNFKTVSIKTYSVLLNGFRLDGNQEAFWQNKVYGFFFKTERIYEIPFSGVCVKLDYTNEIFYKFSCGIQESIWTYERISDEEMAALSEDLTQVL